MNGWAVALNGVLVTRDCDPVELGDLCADLTVVDMLSKPPEGLSTPGLRTEDVTYFQRDGSKHFNDWYTSRLVTLEGVVGPVDCDDPCTAARELLFELGEAWQRSCCDTEAVIYPPCPVPHTEANAYPPTACIGEGFGFGEGPFGEGPFGGALNCDNISDNLAENPSAETETGWDTSDTSTTLSWDTTQFFVGLKSVRSEKTTDNDTDVLASVEHCGEDGTAGIGVTEGVTYTGSVWVRAAQTGYKTTLTFDWDTGTDVTGTEVVLADSVWTRVTVTGTAPAAATGVNIICTVAAETGEAAVGDVVNVDACLLETGSTLNDYYDGDTDPVYDAALEGWFLFTWDGDPNESVTSKQFQAARFKATVASGPYGMVGRPRVFQYEWLDRAETIAQVVMRFDGVDQRLYLLDECGTPGTGSNVTITPGAQLFSRCTVNGVRCRTGGLRCYTNPVDGPGSVEPVALNVGGTQKVYPTITLFGPLTRPRVENVTTGEYVLYDGTIADLPVTINTMDGTAFDAEGTSKTHLLRGSLFLSMYPGNYEWRLLAVGSENVADPGYALIGWRDTVINA